MSKIGDVLIGFEEEFVKAEAEFDRLINSIKRNGYNVKDAVAAALCYGEMVGIAKAENEVAFDFMCSRRLEEIGKPKLMREDFE